MLVHLEKALGTYCLLLCFESYRGIPYSHTGWWTEDGEHFAND